MELSRTDIVGHGGLHRWSRALLILAWLGIVWSIYQLGDSLFGPRMVMGFQTASGVKILTQDDFSFTQRLIVVGMASLPLWCWIYCLSQIVRLAQGFARGEILTLGLVDCLQNFGYGMFAQGLMEALLPPMLSGYLVGLGKIDPVERIWEHIIGSGALTSLMAAVLVLIIARIFRIGIRLREDAELTI